MIKEGIEMYYVYLHKRKGTNKVFYVGKGTKSKSGINRIESDKNRNIHWHRVVEKDGGYDYEIYEDNLQEQDALDLETQLINEIGLENLVNMTHGGVGGDTLSNHPNIDEIGKKISEHHKGKNNPNYGKGYIYWWEKKYGKDKAKEMLKEYLETRTPSKYKGTRGMFTTGLFGDKNPAKRNDVRRKLSDKKKEYWKKQKNNKVECQKCGKLILPMNVNRHQSSKNCR